MNSDVAVRRVKCPVYIVHGKRDTLVPYSSALKLYSRIPSTLEREMITFSNGYHSDLYRFPRFKRTLVKLLDQAATHKG